LNKTSGRFKAVEESPSTRLSSRVAADRDTQYDPALNSVCRQSPARYPR
jgi:hypothetical protein